MEINFANLSTLENFKINKKIDQAIGIEHADFWPSEDIYVSNGLLYRSNLIPSLYMRFKVVSKHEIKVSIGYSNIDWCNQLVLPYSHEINKKASVTEITKKCQLLWALRDEVLKHRKEYFK